MKNVSENVQKWKFVAFLRVLEYSRNALDIFLVLPQSNQQHKTKQNSLVGVVLLSVKKPPPHHHTGMITF
jgi:hypothetical protein